VIQLRYWLLRLIFISVLLSGLSAWAQAPGEDEEFLPRAFEFGVFGANLLPSDIDGVTEIMSIVGVRTGWSTSDTGALEFGFFSGKEAGQEWNNASISVRSAIPVEDLVGLVFIGADVTRHIGVGESEVILGGGHAGGGVMTNVSDDLWFRVDMKFGLRPGTTMMIALGFTVRWPEGDNNQQN
jgi:hypothetical protein